MIGTMDRAQHIAWCKKRARPYLEEGEWFSLNEAFQSMMSDMGKHEETRNHSFIKVGMLMLMAGALATTEAMRDFIEGFN